MAKLTSGPLETLYIGPKGSEVRIGETIAPLTFAPSSAEYVRLRTEQQAGTIGISDVHSIAFMASTMLAEATVENIARAVGLPVSAVEGGKKIIITSPTLPEVSLLATGPGPEDTEEAVADRPRSRLISMPRCISMSLGGGDPLLSWSRAEQTGIPLSFELLQTPSTGEFFTVRDYKPLVQDPVVRKNGNANITTKTAEATIITFDGISGNTKGDKFLSGSADAVGDLTATLVSVSKDGVAVADPNFSVEVSGGALLLKNGATAIVPMTHNGTYVALVSVVDTVGQRTDGLIGWTVKAT
ncbi:MAG: hypothetical protein F4Y39_24730 [Gemmatimonadetes bacterium]|nr:hypothetical protein [Gemmatimonadota bacterium]MYF80030.1 hypothetical protein [Chloroflexota bacterium]